MNLTNNKNLNMENLIYEKIEPERNEKSNSKENLIGLKKSSSVIISNKILTNNQFNQLFQNNNQNNNLQNSIKKNPQNTIIHNTIYIKKKRNVSINDNQQNKIIKNAHKKINNIQKHKIIDLSDRENSMISNLNHYECINSNNKSKEKDWISYIQSKTQRAREYSLIVKKNNMLNSINHNSDRENIISSASKSKSISKSKQNKFKGRSNSNISTICKPKLLDDISFWVRKINIKREKKRKEIEDKFNRDKNNNNRLSKLNKSRNVKNENMIFKSSSIENNKKNIFSSSSLSINVKTVFHPKNGTYRMINNNKSNKKKYYKNYNNFNNFINNNIINTLGANYAQLYIKKNMIKSTYDNNNFSVNNQTINIHKPLISTRINHGKINPY